jgi:hypothetical protein
MNQIWDVSRLSACCPIQTATQSTTMPMVTTGRLPTRPPKTVVVARVVAAWAFTQSTHWTPTAADRWHSGQVGRPQRWQRT